MDWWDPCTNCFGEGWEPGASEEAPCPTCHELGILDGVTCDLCHGEGCPRCDNQGVLYDITCPTCEGRGSVDKRVKCVVCKGKKKVLPMHLFSKEKS